MIVPVINKHWSWTGIAAKEVIFNSIFGNVIFLAESGEYWRICPEELYCKVIAESKEELHELLNSEEFKEDWEMADLTELARKKLGDPDIGEKYCLKLPIVFGGEYSEENLGTILQVDQLSYSGQMTQTINDLPDGTKIEFNV